MYIYIYIYVYVYMSKYVDRIQWCFQIPLELTFSSVGNTTCIRSLVSLA